MRRLGLQSLCTCALVVLFYACSNQADTEEFTQQEEGDDDSHMPVSAGIAQELAADGGSAHGRAHEFDESVNFKNLALYLSGDLVDHSAHRQEPREVENVESSDLGLEFSDGFLKYVTPESFQLKGKIAIKLEFDAAVSAEKAYLIDHPSYNVVLEESVVKVTLYSESSATQIHINLESSSRPQSLLFEYDGSIIRVLMDNVPKYREVAGPGLLDIETEGGHWLTVGGDLTGANRWSGMIKKVGIYYLGQD